MAVAAGGGGGGDKALVTGPLKNFILRLPLHEHMKTFFYKHEHIRDFLYLYYDKKAVKIRIFSDPYHGWRQDPDPYHRWSEDPDSDPYRCISWIRIMNFLT